MKLIYLVIFTFLSGSLLLPVLMMAQPQIQQITLSDSTIELNGKLEITLDITANYTNPYDYDQIEVWAEFTGPDSQIVHVDGFFMEDFILNANGSLTATGSGFKIRFAPFKMGSWGLQVFAKDMDGTTNSAPISFSSGPRTHPENHGYLRTNHTNYLAFDDGEPFVLVGENMCWQNNNAFLDYTKWLDELDAAGGNYFRLWHAHWGLGIEWKNNWNDFEGLRRYKETNSRYQDWLYDYCAEKGIYIMLALQHHGPVSTQVNPNWDDSPYNVANGGPCQNTWDFFTNSTAIAHTKNRYRYIVARWGYARSMMAWELFNEVEWTDNYETYKTEVMDWHAEMAAYLKSIDPYGHIVTTSFAKENNDPMVWANSDIDITQTHFYINTPHIERAMVSGIRTYLDEYDKPTMNGEFGIGLSSTLPTVDPNGIHIHNGLWAAMFGGGMGTGMTWWWDIYIDPQDLYYHFEGVAAVTEDVPFLAGNMKPADAIISGAPGDLSITPTQDWGEIGIDSIFINQDGGLTPDNPGGQLGSFLYGSVWNTQYRSPPVFTVFYPSNGTFTVKTGGNAGNSPKIEIRVNGAQVLNQSAQTNQSYTVNVNAGWNTIRVDNTGTDWINIGGYEFSGLGSKLDAYVLRSANEKIAAGYVLYTDYNYEEVVANGAPSPVAGATLQVTGFTDSAYFVKWYDCLTGAIVAVDPIVVDSGVLDLQIPDMYWDYAFIVDDKDANVTSLEEDLSLSYKVYPNPARPGSVIQIEWEGKEMGEAEIDLLDMSGRLIHKESVQVTPLMQIKSPGNLSSGFYWIRVRTENRVGSQPIIFQ